MTPVASHTLVYILVPRQVPSYRKLVRCETELTNGSRATSTLAFANQNRHFRHAPADKNADNTGHTCQLLTLRKAPLKHEGEKRRSK